MIFLEATFAGLLMYGWLMHLGQSIQLPIGKSSECSWLLNCVPHDVLAVCSTLFHLTVEVVQLGSALYLKLRSFQSLASYIRTKLQLQLAISSIYTLHHVAQILHDSLCLPAPGTVVIGTFKLWVSELVQHFESVRAQLYTTRDTDAMKQLPNV